MSRQPSSELSVADVEDGRIRSMSETPVSQTRSSCHPKPPPRDVFFYYERAENAVWKRIGARDAPEEFLPWNKSIWYMVTLSGVNVFFIALPLAWISHFEGWSHQTTFVLCFIAMIPLQKIFDWGGDEISAFLDEDLRDLLVITLSNAVEATLAMILLHKCELRLLQSTIIGVVLLHLLLIPGTAFFVEGTKVFQQMLQPHHANLNLSLLMIGVLATLVPTAFFAALDRGASNPAGTQSDSGLPPSFVPLVSDYVRRDILSMSRGISVILLVIYAMSRVWRHVLTRIEPSRPGMPKREDTSITVLNANSTPDIPASGQGQVSMEKIPTRKRPTVHPGVCVVFLLVAVALMAVTAEFLVQSIDNVRETSRIQTEWFGLILLPIVSFSADGVIAIWKFFESNFAAPLVSKLPRSLSDRLKNFRIRLRRAFRMDSLSSAGIQGSSNADDGDEPEFAHGRPIDLSIQFTLWWTPFLVLLGWWTDRPMHLLFDYFEVAMLLGACFLVNYILSDSKTNMAEGLTMISFYAMIATAVWFYPGQPQVAFMLTCPGTVAEAVARGAEGVSDLAAL